VLSKKALRAEALALTEIIRFDQVERSRQETKDEYSARLQAQEATLNRALEGLRGLTLPSKSTNGPHYLNMAVQLVAKLSKRYAVVAVVPSDKRRILVRYERTEIPSLNTAREGFKGMLRMLIGSRPVRLNASARNGVTCQSYHLYVKAPDYLYLAAFDIDPIRETTDVAQSGNQQAPYVRVRGRRGQSYFHMYGRLMRTTQTDRLTAAVKFFEVPPGSIGKSASAAVAAWFVVCVVGAIVSWAENVGAVDTQVVAFLLAVPGIAAAWLGLESRPGALFEGTLTARISLVVTFFISLIASTLLLLHESDILQRVPVTILFAIKADLAWTILAVVSAIHAVLVSCVWWHRTQYYRALVAKPGDGSSAMFSA
jgi:hypothetical protein